jgi:hypothetical protein
LEEIPGFPPCSLPNAAIACNIYYLATIRRYYLALAEAASYPHIEVHTEQRYEAAIVIGQRIKITILADFPYLHLICAIR